MGDTVQAQVTGAREEWRAYWYLPFVAALGYSTVSLPAYAMGPFFVPIQEALGWTRAQIAFGLTISNTLVTIFLPTLGPVIDRFGPRRIGLIGVVLLTVAYGSLGVATGTAGDWWMHWVAIAIGQVWCQGTIWTGAVVGRFRASRGLALAITVSGNSVANAVLPPLTTWLIAEYGWRGGFTGIALVYAGITLPLVFLFFRGAQDDHIAARATKPDVVTQHLPGLSVREGLRRANFYKLLLVAFCFAFTIIGTIVHFVPILTSFGASAMGAAGIASVIGITSLMGRFIGGVALDRLPPHLVGMVTYLLPVVGVLALFIDGHNTVAQIICAAAFGLTLGAEVDIIVYLVTRHFGLRGYGTLMSMVFSAIAFGTGVGPYVAGAIFDQGGNYTGYMIAVTALTVTSALVLSTMRAPPDVEDRVQPV